MKNISISFINSDSPWFEIHWNIKDALYDKGWLQWYLSDGGFPAELLDNDIPYKKLEELRTLLSETFDLKITGKELTQELLDNINRYLSNSSRMYEIKMSDLQIQLTLAPFKKDWDYVISEIAASFAKMISDDDFIRLKRCGNPDCKSIFYDSSKNQTRKWCCNTCSSLIKVRRYRAKNKQDENKEESI